MTAFAALNPTNIARVDLAAVHAHNKTAPGKYQLRTELGALAFEGDLEHARVALLLSNPGYGADSTSDAHTFQRDGWPLAGIHQDAPSGTYKWNSKLLRRLVEVAGARRVSQRVLKLELTPWASMNFPQGLVLPSRQLVYAAAGELARRGVVLVVMHSEREWLKVPEVLASPKRCRVNNWRCAAVSPGNLSPQGWTAVVDAVCR